MTSTEAPPDWREWVERFRERHGRPLRILHIGNIANNAYINAKLQRRDGVEADVACYDYYHIMGCPEWEDADFAGDVGDQFFPDWRRVDLKGFERPTWFVQGRLKTCVRYLRAARSGQALRTRLRWRQLTLERWLLCRSTRFAWTIATLLGLQRGNPPLGGADRSLPLPPGASLSTRLEWYAHELLVRLVQLGVRATRTTGRLVRLSVRFARRAVRRVIRIAGLATMKTAASGRAVRALSRGESWRTAVLLVFPRRLRRVAVTEEQRELVRRAVLAAHSHQETQLGEHDPDPDEPMSLVFAELFPDRPRQLSWADLTPYRTLAGLFGELLQSYDIVQGYALDPAIPMLAGFPHFAAYEHGTLRDLPFEESPRGRICALSYRLAPRVFVTNSDVLPAARRLGLSESQMVFLPHAVDSERLRRFAASHDGTRPSSPPIRLFSPTRHDWADNDPLWAKGNDRLIRGLAIARDDGLDCTATLVAWGRHVEESKQLIAELGLDGTVSWIDPLRKQSLWRAFLEHHAVVDQFLTPALGSIAFESLALGCRVITALDAETVTEFFGEMPPVLNCRTPQDVAEAIQAIAADPLDAAGIGQAAQEWFAHRHSSERILALEFAAYRELLEA